MRRLVAQGSAHPVRREPQPRTYISCPPATATKRSHFTHAAKSTRSSLSLFATLNSPPCSCDHIHRKLRGQPRVTLSYTSVTASQLQEVTATTTSLSSRSPLDCSSTTNTTHSLAVYINPSVVYSPSASSTATASFNPTSSQCASQSTPSSPLPLQ
jgi:hypothetical protein